jgi:hypothetical protein
MTTASGDILLRKGPAARTPFAATAGLVAKRSKSIASETLAGDAGLVGASR